MRAKHLFRNAIATALYKTGVSAATRRGCGKLSIATFHRVLPECERDQYPYPGLVVTPEELDTFLTYFVQHFECGTLATQHKRYLSRENCDRPLLALTFDDAQADNFRHARPVLDRHNICATFFAPVQAIEQSALLWHDRLGFAVLSLLKRGKNGIIDLNEIIGSGLQSSSPLSANEIAQIFKKLPIDKRLHLVNLLAAATEEPPEFARLMNFSELSELASDGHEIGSHSMTHCLMPECSDTQLLYELTQSKRVLEDRLGCEVESFCYPNGNADDRSAQSTGRAGYKRAVTTTSGMNNYFTNPFQLFRFNMETARVINSDNCISAPLIALRMSGILPIP